MNNTYHDLIKQTFDFPQEGFRVEDNYLQFNDVNLMDIIAKYGTPLKLTYLPKISSQIQKAKASFRRAFKELKYEGKYHYCYCTKSSHFTHILEEVLENDTHMETSYAFDIDIVRKLYERGLFEKDRYIICNGFKTKLYTTKIAKLINDGFTNVIPVLDNKEEIDRYQRSVKGECNIGIRIAAEEEPSFQFYTSRLGIRWRDILEFYVQKIHDNKKFKLKMLHFFINTGIKDDAYYWSELNKALNVYCQLRKICPTLDSINIGGGFPIKNSLAFDYDYDYMIKEIVTQIKSVCKKNRIPVPDIFTEFGSFTVGESGVAVYKVIAQKQQNDNELWYMIDSSFITTLPDTWGIGQRFLMLPVNKWDKEYQRVNLGGLTCDSHDYYNSEAHINQVFLPKVSTGEPLYIGFFHVGAYQDQLAGYGGIKHCLIPSPQHILVDHDAKGNLRDRVFAKQQSASSMLKILGYEQKAVTAKRR
ncbi:MAG TPA: arginine decarboxylase [Chitinophagales bacterium]|nr:arginine decarboxylase [Chitinophagales bacterium]